MSSKQAQRIVKKMRELVLRNGGIVDALEAEQIVQTELDSYWHEKDVCTLCEGTGCYTCTQSGKGSVAFTTLHKKLKKAVNKTNEIIKKSKKDDGRPPLLVQIFLPLIFLLYTWIDFLSGSYGMATFFGLFFLFGVVVCYILPAYKHIKEKQQ